jgi:glutaredoxin
LLIVALTALSSAASGESLYRYLDPSGRVVYSDQPPPPSARQVEPKRLPQNVIETDPVPFAAKEAAEKNPVTLYTFDCEVCKQAESLLAKRGVPFKSVIVSEEAGAAKLMALTGKQSAPVLQIGEKQVMTGFNADRWHAMLDQAGYPKSAPSRQVARTQAAPAAEPTDAAARPAAPMAPPAAATPGSDYPK